MIRIPFRPIDVFKFAVPTICDVIASTLFNIGIYYADISVYQMLRNMTICVVALLSSLLFKDFRNEFDIP